MTDRCIEAMFVVESHSYLLCHACFLSVTAYGQPDFFVLGRGGGGGSRTLVFD